MRRPVVPVREIAPAGQGPGKPMKCKYCGEPVENPRATVCPSRMCRNQGKNERKRARRAESPKAHKPTTRDMSPKEIRGGRCKYCGTDLTRPNARVCESEGCRKRGKKERRVARSGGLAVAIDPPELKYLDDGPVITPEQLLDLKRDPELRRKTRETRALRQQKLTQRIREVGLYDAQG